MIPLAIQPGPTPEIVAILREAKAGIQTDVKIMPVQDLPGGPQPVLSFGVKPQWAADHIVIAPDGVNDVNRVRAALQHWLDGGAPTYTAADILSEWMGAPVEQIIDEFSLGNVEHALEQQRQRMRPS